MMNVMCMHVKLLIRSLANLNYITCICDLKYTFIHLNDASIPVTMKSVLPMFVKPMRELTTSPAIKPGYHRNIIIKCLFIVHS